MTGRRGAVMKSFPKELGLEDDMEQKRDIQFVFFLNHLYILKGREQN